MIKKLIWFCVLLLVFVLLFHYGIFEVSENESNNKSEEKNLKADNNYDLKKNNLENSTLEKYIIVKSNFDRGVSTGGGATIEKFDTPFKYLWDFSYSDGKSSTFTQPKIAD